MQKGKIRAHGVLLNSSKLARQGEWIEGDLTTTLETGYLYIEANSDHSALIIGELFHVNYK